MPVRKVFTVARASASLPAAGAWDTPTEFDCGQFDYVTIYMTYAISATAAANTGYADLLVETSPDKSDWHADSIIDNESSATAVANGLDTWQGEVYPHVIYHDTPGTTTATLGIPKFRVRLDDSLGGRCSVREAGEVGKPGTVKVTFAFVENNR